MITLVAKKEEALDDLFTYMKGDEQDYFSPEDPKDWLYDFIPTGKGEVATQGNEDEDVEIVETPGDAPIHEEILPTSTEDIVQKVITSKDSPTEIDMGKVGHTGVASIKTVVAVTAEAPLTEATPVR